MHIWDNRNRSWLIVTVVLSAHVVVLHVGLSWREPRPLGGGSTLGLWLGVAGSILMLYVGLVFVALRQRDRRLRASWPLEFGYRAAALLLLPLRLLPEWRSQPRAWWLRAHVWMGLFSVVIILCHSGYRWGGWLTVALWVILISLIVSGFIGLLLQQFLPHLLAVRFPTEAPYGQIPYLRRVAAGRAAELHDAFVGPSSKPDEPAVHFAMPIKSYLNGESSFKGEFDIETYFESARLRLGWPRLEEERRQQQMEALSTAVGAKWDAKRVGELLDADPPQDLRVKLEQVSKPLSAAQAQELATILRDRWLEELESLCRQWRDWDRQEVLYAWLHGWLLVHIPLSVTLLFLVIAHVIVALYY